MPQLVFLSGCRTGEASGNGAVSSLAESLIEQGCRAVLGWGRPIADTVATQTAAYLYSKLAAGYQLAEALTSTYQHLRESRVEDWHLLRLYISGQCPKALVEPLGDQVWLPEEPIYEQFLDSQGIVRVATPQEFVGRRRTLQRSLKALRSAEKLGVLVHGLGGVGKSTVAARLLERLQGYEQVFVYRQLDEDKLLRQLAEQCLSENGQEILQGKLPLAQKLTKFLREGLNEPTQRLLFVLDDFEANLELRTDGSAVLKPDAATVLMSLLRAITQSRLPHRLIITSRYNFPLPELDQRLHREQLAALSGTDLQKKCNRLASFAPGSEVDQALQFEALEASTGNPRLLEWLDKVLQAQHLNQSQILEQVKIKSQEFRESILAEELLNRQSSKLRRMLGFCLAYQLPVPQSAIEVLCPKTFDVDTCIPKSVAIGLLECTHREGEILYYVPRILEPLLDFPEDSIELYKTAVEHLDAIWFFKGLQNDLNARKELLEASPYEAPLEQALSTDRLLELYRLASKSLMPDILSRANWFLVMRLDQQKRYREVATLCKFVMEGAFGYLGMHIVSSNLLYFLAKAQEQLGEVEEALHNYQRALEICSQQCEAQEDSTYYKAHKASILHDLADLHEKQGNYQEALELCLQVIQLDEFSGNELGKAKSLNQLAGIKRSLGESEEALTIFQEAYEFAKKSKDENLIHGIRNNIATLRVDLGQPAAWDDALTDLALYETQSQDPEIKIQSLINNASFKLKQGEIEEAKKFNNQALALLPQIENTWIKAGLLHNVATFNSEDGDRDLALKLYNQALELHRKNGDQLHEAMTLQEIGILYERQDNVDEALKFLEESYRLSLRIGNKGALTHVLLRTAALLINKNDLDEAEEKLNAALELANTIKSPERQVFALREMGRLQVKRGNYHAGADYLRQALEKCSLITDVILQATVLKFLGEVMFFLGDIDIAIEHLTESLIIYQRINFIEDIDEVTKLIQDAQLTEPAKLYQAAIAEAEKGHSRVAIDLLEQALPMIERLGEEEIRANILLLMGNLLVDEGYFREGVSRASQAIEIVKQHNPVEKERVEKVAFSAQYGKLKHLFDEAQKKCKRQEFNEALPIANQSLELAEILNDAHWCSHILSLLGQAKALQGDYEGGIQDLRKAFALAQENQPDRVEELQQIIFTVNSHEAGRLYEQAYAAAQERKLEEAIELSQKAYEFQSSVNHKDIQPATLSLLGHLLRAQGKAEEGLQRLQQALNIAQELQAQEIINQLQEIILVFTQDNGQ